MPGAHVVCAQAHVGRIKGARPGVGGAYLLFRDSSWRSAAAVQRTCLHLDDLAAALRAVPFRQRLVILDVVSGPSLNTSSGATI